MKLFLVLLATLGFSFSVFAQEGQVTQDSQTVEAARAKKDSKNKRGPASVKKKKDKKKKKAASHKKAHKKANHAKKKHEPKHAPVEPTVESAAAPAPDTMEPMDPGVGMDSVSPTAEEFQ